MCLSYHSNYYRFYSRLPFILSEWLVNVCEVYFKMKIIIYMWCNLFFLQWNIYRVGKTPFLFFQKHTNSMLLSTNQFQYLTSNFFKESFKHETFSLIRTLILWIKKRNSYPFDCFQKEIWVWNGLLVFGFDLFKVVVWEFLVFKTKIKYSLPPEIRHTSNDKVKYLHLDICMVLLFLSKFHAFT